MLFDCGVFPLLQALAKTNGRIGSALANLVHVKLWLGGSPSTLALRKFDCPNAALSQNVMHGAPPFGAFARRAV